MSASSPTDSSASQLLAGRDRHGGHPDGPAPPVLPRLLAGAGDGGSQRLSSHLQRWGWPRLAAGPELVEALELSGLRGRGGAAFPTATKWKAVGARRLRRPVVVANASESEPASAKDRLLLTRAPHLVLDGLALAAETLGAARAFAFVPEDLCESLLQLVAERTAAGIDRVGIEPVPALDRFVAGEESAVVSYLNGGPGGRPTFTRLRPVYEKGVGGRPTLVQNAETLAHVALISRFGPKWFRQLGTSKSPGSALLTLTVPGQPARVVEVALGTPLKVVLESANVTLGDTQGVLLGGYGGTWLATKEALDLDLSEDRARRASATLGAGVVVILPKGRCPLVELAEISRYMSEESAGQCGPCVNGLAELAASTRALALAPSELRGTTRFITETCDLVEGRGACRHPDGVVRMVRSALRAFSPHVQAHLSGGPCSGARGVAESHAGRRGRRHVVRYVEGGTR